MMTKRSSHMPMLIRIEMTKSARRLVRTFLENSVSGARQLQKTIVQKNGAYEPTALSRNVPISNELPPYHATQNSVT